MTTLARLVAILCIVFYVSMAAALVLVDGHWLFALLYLPTLAFTIVLGGEAAADAEVGVRAPWITVRHRYLRWRRRLQQLGGGSTALAFHPYR